MLQLPFLRRYIGRFDLQDLDDINKKKSPSRRFSYTWFNPYFNSCKARLSSLSKRN